MLKYYIAERSMYIYLDASSEKMRKCCLDLVLDREYPHIHIYVELKSR